MVSVDVEKAIKDVETEYGRELTEKERKMAEAFGFLVKCMWESQDEVNKNGISDKDQRDD